MCAWQKEKCDEHDYAQAARREAIRMRDEICARIGEIRAERMSNARKGQAMKYDVQLCEVLRRAQTARTPLIIRSYAETGRSGAARTVCAHIRAR